MEQGILGSQTGLGSQELLEPAPPRAPQDSKRGTEVIEVDVPDAAPSTPSRVGREETSEDPNAPRECSRDRERKDKGKNRDRNKGSAEGTVRD